MTTEQWRPIPGYDGGYEISTLGEIRTWFRPGPGDGRRDTPKIMKTYKRFTKYGPALMITLRGERPCRVKILMRDVWMQGNVPGMKVKFQDGDFTNCSLANLRYISTSEVNRNPGNRCPVAKCDATGRVLQYYQSIAEAARENFWSKSGLQKAISEERLVGGCYYIRASEFTT